MPMRRRRFIQALTAAPLVPMVARASTALEVPPAPSPTPLPARPQGLRKGARVGIACPASGVTRKDLRDFETLCTQLGFVPVFGKNVSHFSGYLAASDRDRADEFMQLIDDTSVDAIICARGGYGVMRILPMLDFGAIEQARKPIVGFSDITALLIAANQLSNVITFHGPVASSTFDQFTIDSFNNVVVANESQAPYTFVDQRLTTLVPGIRRGRLTGGNLAMVAATLGTAYEIDTQGAILFLEEINEEPYRIDRMLTQLWLAGKLQQAAGIALGNFRNCEVKKQSISEPSFTLRQVLDDRLSDLGIPVVYGLPFGHVKSKLTLPLGIVGELDATNKTLRILTDAVT